MPGSRPGARAFAASLGFAPGRGQPLARSVAAAIRDAVMDGRIPVGSALPAERALAEALAVSRGTVVAGLSELRDGGWIRTRHGSGSTIRLPPGLTERTTPWSLDRFGTGADLDMTHAVTAAPHEAYLAAVRRAADLCPTLLVDAGTPSAGHPPLRDLLAQRYTAEGLPTRPEQILVTSGAQAALDLLAGHLHDRRRPVVTENPTYPGGLAVLRRHRARLLPVPVTAQGWDLPRLRHAVRSAGADLAYLVPDFHNPTGALMPDSVRAEVAALAGRHGLTVVVDETMRDLDLRTPPRPVRHLAGPAVVSIGSTSKSVWGGLRVGWIRASAARVRELLLDPLQPRLSPPPLEQLIAHDLLQRLDGILADRRARLRRQRDHLAALLAGSDGWTHAVPPGGLALWLRLEHATAADVADRALRRGLALSPGPWFSPDRTLTHHLRLPFTATPDLLTRAVDVLTAAQGDALTDPAAGGTAGSGVDRDVDRGVETRVDTPAAGLVP